MPACLRFRTLVDPNVLLHVLCGARPIEGCSAVVAIRRYGGVRSLVCDFVVCAEEESSKKENSWLFVFLGASSGDIAKL